MKVLGVNMKLDKTIYCMSIMSIVAFTQNAQCGEVLERIKAQKTLRVGTTGDYRPFTYRNKENLLTGADVQMAEMLAVKLGVRVKFIPSSWADLERDFVAKRFDVAMGGVTVQSKRSALGPFSHIVYADGKRPITRCKDAKSLNQN